MRGGATTYTPGENEQHNSNWYLQMANVDRAVGKIHVPTQYLPR